MCHLSQTRPFTETKQVDSPASKVWEKVAEFRGIEESSPIARSVVEGNGVGAKRTCYMPDDTVKALSETTSEVSWGSESELDGAGESEIRPLFEGFYATTIDGLDRLLK